MSNKHWPLSLRMTVDDVAVLRFCNAVVQITAETGEPGKLIEDMAKQLNVLKETTFIARKKSTENKLQLCIIGIFIMFTVLIFFLCIASMVGSTNILF